MQAKNYQKNLLKKKNKSIVKKKRKNSTIDCDEREMIIETRNARMRFDQSRHDDMKKIESEKLKLEQERLKMDMDSMLLEQQQERSRLVLLKLEMFKERQSIKKEYPEVTEEYLEANFPYPE